MDEVFFKTFDIPPYIKKGQTYMEENKLVTKVAKEDKYFDIDSDKILELERILIDENLESHIEIYHDENQKLWGYVHITGLGDDYHHGFAEGTFETRKDALLAHFIEYSHVPYIYESVREVFGQR